MVARLTPDQKVACSIHVGFNTPILSDPFFFFLFRINSFWAQFYRGPIKVQFYLIFHWRPIIHKAQEADNLRSILYKAQEAHHIDRLQTKTLNPLLEPSPPLVSSSPPPSPLFRTGETPGEPSRTFDCSGGPPPPRAATMATVMQKIKDIEDEVTSSPSRAGVRRPAALRRSVAVADRFAALEGSSGWGCGFGCFVSSWIGLMLLCDGVMCASFGGLDGRLGQGSYGSWVGSSMSWFFF